MKILFDILHIFSGDELYNFCPPDSLSLFALKTMNEHFCDGDNTFVVGRGYGLVIGIMMSAVFYSSCSIHTHGMVLKFVINFWCTISFYMLVSLFFP